MRKSILLAALAAQGLLAAGCATAVDERALRAPKINFNTPAAVKYAFGEGCLPSVVEGKPISALLRPSVVTSKTPGVTNITTKVWVEENAAGCTVIAIAADPEPLRAAVLDWLKGAPLRPVTSRGTGPIQQEAYCLTLANRPAQLVVSTRSGVPARMAATLALAKDGPCAARPR
jgi:hypothetical protein